MNRAQLKRYLIEQLQEHEPDNQYGHPWEDLDKIVSEHSEKYCLQLLEDAQKLYKAGIRTKDESRPRTLGGCFFFINKHRRKGKL